MAATSGNSDAGGLAPAPAMRQWSEPDFSQLHLLSYETFCEVADQHELQLSNTIDAIKGSIARLRGMRNSRNPHIVRRLPTELLVHIFADVSHPSDLRSSRSLISVTQVCGAWRAIALDTPALWSSIVVTSLSKDGVYSFVERSRGSLLYLRLQDPLVSMDSRILYWLQSRLRSLTVAANDITRLAQVAKILARGASPHLDTLDLLGPDANCSSYGHLASNVSTILRENPSIPSLRFLHLRNVVFAWTSDIYSNLSVLDIDVPFTAPLSEGELLTVLRRCPALVELRLSVFTSLTSPQSPQGHSLNVTLPRLSIFSIKRLYPEHASSLLAHLELPRSTRFQLSLSIYPSKRFSRTFAAALPHDLRGLPGLAAIKALTFEASGRDDIVSTLYPANAQPVMATLTDELDDLKVPFVPTAVIDSLETLESIGEARFKPDFWNWHDCLCRVVHLRVLRFVRPLSDELMHILESMMQPATPTSVFPCPELERLELVDVSFTLKLEDRIADVVSERAKKGYPIRELVVRGAVGASSGFLQRLGGLGVV